MPKVGIYVRFASSFETAQISWFQIVGVRNTIATSFDHQISSTQERKVQTDSVLRPDNDNQPESILRYVNVMDPTTIGPIGMGWLIELVHDQSCNYYFCNLESCAGTGDN